MRWRSYTQIAATFRWAKSRIVLRNLLVINRLMRYFRVGGSLPRRKGIKFCHMVEARRDRLVTANRPQAENCKVKHLIIGDLFAQRCG